MKEFKYTITDSQGIHARPRGLLVKEDGKNLHRISKLRKQEKQQMRSVFSV